MTLLCVPIMVQGVSSALADAHAAKAAGADLVEYRLDDVFTGELMSASSGDTPEVKQILELIAQSPLPAIVTCRPAGPEGGHYDGDDMARVSLFERLGTAFGPGEHPPRYLDVELSTLARSANLRQKVRLAVDHPEQVRDLKTSLVLSSHDFAGRPTDLTRRVAAMRAESAAKVLKIAFRARSLRDNLELFDLLGQRDRPTIALGMGEFGLMSRVLAPKFGGFLTFASLRSESATAPGQPTIAELLGLYRFRSIGPATRVYGVIGWPVGHSRSPLVHNAGFEAIGFDGVYLPMPVAGDDAGAGALGSGGSGGFESLKATLLEFIDHAALGFGGASVTIPHKENLLRLAEEQGWAVDPVARAVGAANTIAVDRSSGAVRVVNTDVAALVESLARVYGSLAGARVAVLGAGGAGRAAAYGLASAGATVVVYNRDRARAERLAAELRERLPASSGKVVGMGLEALERSCAQAYVNCTPVGMAGTPQARVSPIPAAVLGGCEAGTVVMDTVYNPIETALLREAGGKGFRTVDGVSMFTHQAAAQFALFTGSPPPTGLFDRIARASLQPPRVG